jgi:hypothetical protein
MKFLLVLALLFAPLAYADTVDFSVSTFVIPNGSVITNATFFSPGFTPCGPNAIGCWAIDFSFPGGSGTAKGELLDGDIGTLTFNQPMSNLTLTWVLAGIDIDIGVFQGGVENFVFSETGNTGSINLPYSGMTSIDWVATGNFGGIDSIVSTPEPSTILLLCMSFFALLAINLFGFRRARGRPR